MSFKEVETGADTSKVFRPSKSSKSSKEVAAGADVVVAWEVEVEKDDGCDLYRTLQQLTSYFNGPQDNYRYYRAITNGFHPDYNRSNYKGGSSLVQKNPYEFLSKRYAI